jgi:hypothetical protein
VKTAKNGHQKYKESLNLDYAKDFTVDYYIDDKIACQHSF